MPSEFNETVSIIRDSINKGYELQKKLNQEIEQLRRDILLKTVQCYLIRYESNIDASLFIFEEGQEIEFIPDQDNSLYGGFLRVTPDDMHWLVSMMPETLVVTSRENRNYLRIKTSCDEDEEDNSCVVSE